LENTMLTPIKAREARANLDRLTDQTSESHQPIFISGKRSGAVLISADDWQAIQETLYLLSVPGMRESIKNGISAPLNQRAEKLGSSVIKCGVPARPPQPNRDRMAGHNRVRNAE